MKNLSNTTINALDSVLQQLEKMYSLCDSEDASTDTLETVKEIIASELVGLENAIINIKELEVITVLEELTNHNTLSSQLRKLTGDTYNTVDFKDFRKPLRSLSAASGNIIEHIKTGRLFKIT